jgi:hypothetical protein
MLYRLIAKLPPSLQAYALLVLPSQKVVAGAIAGALTAALAAVAVALGVEVPPAVSSAVTALSAAAAAYLVKQDPDTPRDQVQRDVARIEKDPRRTGLAEEDAKRVAVTGGVQRARAVARESDPA